MEPVSRRRCYVPIVVVKKSLCHYSTAASVSSPYICCSVYCYRSFYLWDRDFDCYSAIVCLYSLFFLVSSPELLIPKPYLATASGVPRGVRWFTPQIPKALQNRAKLNPIVKTVKKKLLNLGRQHPKMFGKKAIKF